MPPCQVPCPQLARQAKAGLGGPRLDMAHSTFPLSPKIRHLGGARACSLAVPVPVVKPFDGGTALQHGGQRPALESDKNDWQIYSVGARPSGVEVRDCRQCLWALRDGLASSSQIGGKESRPHLGRGALAHPAPCPRVFDGTRAPSVKVAVEDAAVGFPTMLFPWACFLCRPLSRRDCLCAPSCFPY